MSARSRQNWQTSLADLSLVLFLITAAAVSRHPAKAAKPSSSFAASPSPAAVSAAPSPQSEPLSVYVAEPGAPPLAQWLGQQFADSRQQLTITVRYGAAPGSQVRALAAAARILTEAGAHGRAARLVVEPGGGPARAVLAYDVPGGDKVAQDLR